MNKDLHDIDDLFRSSLELYEEAPSSSVKKKLEAALDKKDAESYRKRFLGWKRAAILLFFLLLGFVLYETGLLKLTKHNSEKNYVAEKNSSPVNNEKTIEDVNLNQKENLNENKKEDESTAGLKNNEAGRNSFQKNEFINTNANTDVSGVNRKENLPDKDKTLTSKQYKHPSKQSKIPDDDITVVQNNTGISKKIIAPDQLAFAILQKTNPAVLITRQPFHPHINDNSVLRNHSLPKNQNKNRIGFKPHWLISAVFAYEAAGYKLDSDLPTEISNIKHREIHEPSFSGGILVTRQFTNHWGLQSGLLYTKTEIGIRPQKIYAFLDPAGDVAYKYVTSSGYAYIKPKTGAPPSFGDSVIATEGKHTLRYITVPLTIKYRAGKNKFSFVPGVGIEANSLSSTRVETEIQTPANNEVVFVNKLYGARSFYWSLSADAEIRYELNKKTMLSFHPSFHHSISPINENNIVETFPYSFRWGVGLTFKL